MLALGALAGRRREQLQRFADLLISGHRAATMTNCPNLAGPKQTAGSNLCQRVETQFRSENI
jgi:hypothetical protein